MSDVSVLGPKGHVFVNDPDVVHSVTRKNVDALRLGGPEPHGRRCGIVHVMTETTGEAYERGQFLYLLLSDQGTLNVRAVHKRHLATTFPK